ncbi:MAG: N-acetyltransferase [Gemmatimonadetes bacterium]|nr:N-acetyltransferase [Gemmatimonadota bacterium]
MVWPPPDRIPTDRLVLHRWQPEHARLLKAAIDANLGHLQAWMPWAAAEPTELPELCLRLAQFSADFDAGARWLYGVFPPDETAVLGGLGLHPTPDGVELGYWLRSDVTGMGYLTEAARAALDLPGMVEVVIRCDPLNTRSAAVAERLGFRHTTTLVGNSTTPSGAPRDTMIWQLSQQPTTT